MARMYLPCRECGKTHTNTKSSSLCNFCGIVEAEKNRKIVEKYHEPFDDFMELTETERWRILWDKIN